MGLASLALGLISRAGSALGLVGGGVASATSRGALSTLGRAVTGPVGQGLVGGIAGAGLGSQFFGPGGPPAGAEFDTQMSATMARLQASGAQVTALAGGRFLATAPNGDVQVFNRNGQAIKPTMIIPAGQRLPGGAVVVSTRQGGALIGITKRRRRKRFGAEIRNVRRTVQAANALVNLCKPKTRRS